MTFVLDESSMQATGWALLHSTWQIALIWLLHLALQAATRRATLDLRYAACCVALLACPAVTAATTIVLWRSPGFSFREIIEPNGLISLARLPSIPALQGHVLRQVTAWLPVAVYAWAAFMVLRFVSTAIAVVALERCVRLARDVDVDRWQALSERIILGRSVHVLESDRVGSPATVGWWRPVVLLPAGLAAEASPAMIEAIVAHELAHIRRGDYLANVLQTLVEAVFWYHPLVRSIGRDLCQLREECCDEAAVMATDGRRADYVHAMATLAEIPVRQTLVLRAVDANVFLRLRHVVDRATLRPSPRLGAAAVAMMLAAVFGVTAMAPSVATRLELRRDIALASKESCCEAVYKLLGVTEGRTGIASAVERAVQERKANTFNGERARMLAESILGGSSPHELMMRSLSSCSAVSLRTRRDNGWAGGGGSAWDDLADALYQESRISPRTVDQHKLARAAVLLAAQGRINLGGRLNRIVQEADFQKRTGYATDLVERLRLLVRVQSVEMAETMLAFEAWKASSVPEMPGSWREGLANRPYLQWHLANYWYGLRYRSAEQASRLHASVRAARGTEIFTSLAANE